MPTYDYRCDNDHTFEEFHAMSDETPRVCPTCGSPARKVPGGGSGFLFKGSGFYITDYRSASYKEGAKADRPASSGGDSGSSKPSKPASGD